MVSKFFSRMFDASQNSEDELLKQVQADLGTASKEGKVATEQVDYEKQPSGEIRVIDKVNNEETTAKPTEQGYELQSDSQSYLLPTLVEEMKKLNDNLAAANQQGSEGSPAETSPKSSEGDATSETKEESAVQVNTKVVLTLDGVLTTAYVVGKEEQAGKVKVRIPSLQNQVIEVLTEDIQVPTAAEADAIASGKTFRQRDQYRSFSRKRDNVPSFSQKTDEFSEIPGPKKYRAKFKTFSSAQPTIKKEGFNIVEVTPEGKLLKIVKKVSSDAEARRVINQSSDLRKKLAESQLDIWSDSLLNSKK